MELAEFVFWQNAEVETRCGAFLNPLSCQMWGRRIGTGSSSALMLLPAPRIVKNLPTLPLSCVAKRP